MTVLIPICGLLKDSLYGFFSPQGHTYCSFTCSIYVVVVVGKEYFEEYYVTILKIRFYSILRVFVLFWYCLLLMFLLACVVLFWNNSENSVFFVICGHWNLSSQLSGQLMIRQRFLEWLESVSLPAFAKAQCNVVVGLQHLARQITTLP